MAIAEFLRQIIPVSLDIWIGLFLLPMTIAVVAQYILLRKCQRKLYKWIPPITGAALIMLLVLGAFIGLSQLLSFLALILMGTGGFILVGSFLGWLAYRIVRFIR